jgi:hypothetical protein
MSRWTIAEIGGRMYEGVMPSVSLFRNIGDGPPEKFISALMVSPFLPVGTYP